MEKIQNQTSFERQMKNCQQINLQNKPVLQSYSAKLKQNSQDTVEFSKNKKNKKTTIAQIIFGISSLVAIGIGIIKCKNKKIPLSLMQTCNLTNSSTIGIDAQLEELAKKLSREYGSFESESRRITEKFIFGENKEAQSLYQELKTRIKGEDSILCKLKAKYQSGKLTLGQNAEENLARARAIINDAYGSRLILKELTQDEYHKVLSKFNIDEKDFCSKINASIKNPKIELEEKYLEAIEELKEAQTKDIFKTLLNGIKNKTIEIEKFENYGDIISSYFSKKQIAQLIDAYSEHNNGKILTVVSKDATGIIEHSKTLTKGVEILDDSQLLSPETYFTTSKHKKIKNIQEAITDDSAVKKSGYTTTQMDIRQKFKSNGNSTGLGEFQIRGAKVNAFGDVEHIPYDIRQGKITADNEKYKEIYQTIKNMSKEQYDDYNKYLTSVYTYLRLQELGINLGKMPVLDDKIAPSIISYEGLLKYAHK